jgi:extracellular factor (EF) 3-hydroxypalmitic acid methyl ester biosynthesis protein
MRICTTPLGKSLDAAFLSLPASKSVRNRRGLLRAEIAKIADAQRGKHVEISSLACGPARERYNTFSEDTQGTDDISFHLLDIDDEVN